MSSNFEGLHEIRNEAYAENFSILSQKLVNPLFYLSLHFLIGIPFKNLSMNVSSSKIGHDFSNKVVQKLTLEKNAFNKKWSTKVIFNRNKKMTLKVRLLALFAKLSFIDRIFLNFFLGF